MSQTIKLDITEACYEGLRCSVCTGYLCFSPIRLLPDGSVLCGRCSSPNDEIPYRALIVESLLSNATFPCRYEQFGCSTNVHFNRVLNHEDGCIHRPFPCASLPHTSCEWEGSISQIPDHFAEKHSDFVQQEAKIKLCANQNKKGVLLVKAAPMPFIVRYTFDSITSSLRYQIGLCITGTDSQDCELQLFNDFDPYYSVNWRAKCFAYKADLSDDNFLNVDVKSLFVVLNNPDNFTLVFCVKLPILTDDGSPNNEVDYKLLDLNRCAECQYYLFPPLFDFDEKTICADCSPKCGSTPTTAKTLENTLTQRNFPCRWPGCNFIGKGGVIGKHQTECNLQMYDCPFCGIEFSQSCMVQHMKAHDCYYFSGKYIHAYELDKLDKLNEHGPYESKTIFSVVDNEIISIDLCYFVDNDLYHFDFEFLSNNNLVGIVYFSHEHCKCRSKEFSFSSDLIISFSDLPECFTEKDITYVTIRIKDD